MPPTTRLFWSSMEPNSEVDVDCFLPTGVLIPMGVRAGSTIAEIKGRLWAEASNYPLFNLLKDIRSYVFVCINQKGKQEELVDENRQLIDVRPFRPLLKLIERKGDREEKLLNSEISCLIGKNLDEFDQMDSPEVNDFRRTYRYMVEEISRERNQLNWEGRAMYAYPPEIETSNDIPAHVEQNLMDNRRFLVNVAIKNKRASIKDLHAFNVSADTYPYELLTLVLKRRGVIMGVHDFDNPGDYVLKIVGQESYLLGEHPLLRYKYIRSCVAKGVRPQLSLNLRVSLKVHELLEVPGTHVLKESQSPPPLPAKPSTMSSLSLWHIETQFKFKVVSASNVNVSDDMKVCLRAGIYHGAEPLCDIKSTSPQEGSTLVWNEYLDFDLKVYDLPRMARLCLVIYGYSSSRKKSKARREDTIPLAWVNTTLFDFCNHLRQGKLRLYCWPVRDSMEDLNPVGTVVTNINTATSPSLLIEFQCYSNTVVYPPYEKVVGLAAESTSKDIFNLREPQQLQQLKSIVDREPLAPIFEQDKELVWFLRIECRENFPHALPKLLNCMKWNCKEDVAQMQILLQTWPELEPEQALELLDYTYADQAVRRFAVQCIEKMSDVELSQYLLQLVQVLKYESYLDCDLAKFLLRRALLNRNIGHVLFWHLRAEMHMPEASVRFGLMLEAYCRGAVAHIKSLLRQVRALDKMKAISTLLQCLDRDKREKALDTMKQCLQQQTYQEALAKLNSPLEPSYKFLKLRVDKCKFMDSKMRPLWMVFENVDELADDIRILFKNGDDLRQDMLTLQLLRLMDNFWQNEGLDLGMTPYGCLSTGDMVGLIEVVLDSTTLANIQKRKGGGVTKGAFVRSSLLDYIKEYNPDEESLNKAIERFTLSCAGYCVATYVLGVGDRHSDNIMVTREGRLLHIDFGHFLGNFKVKFGVRRERVPFVLTRDFGYVIAKGRNNEIEKSDEFQRFKRICEQAFTILRRKGHLLITLFVMMLSTGIPELRTLDDINYLRKTLALSDTEEDAVKKFRDKFDEAWRNSWKTNANWAVHNYAKNNPH